jgi:hypothetical protein
VSWGALLIGAIVCAFVGWVLVREVHAGRRSRFGAAVVYGVAVPVTGAVPLLIAVGARWLGSLAGVSMFSGNGGNDGALIGVGLMGFGVAFGGMVLFAAVMVFQALTGSGHSPVNGRRR